MYNDIKDCLGYALLDNPGTPFSVLVPICIAIGHLKNMTFGGSPLSHLACDIA